MIALEPCCIISSFYIKPQQIYLCIVISSVVLYLHSTSNHNRIRSHTTSIVLYYIFILHQTTTGISDRWSFRMLYYIFILHQTTTIFSPIVFRLLLYYIFILHQTTTSMRIIIIFYGCIISSFYIKPQQEYSVNNNIGCCIISSFYIKPQLVL